VPRGRLSSVADVILPKYQRRQPEFDAAVMASFVLGHSTRKSVRFFTQLFGDSGISRTQVSHILAKVDEGCRAWRNRRLDKPYVYLWLDGKCAAIAGALKRPYSVLWAYAATEDMQRELIGFQVHRSEGTVHWESLLIHLLDRGLDPKGLKLVIRDENSGCEQAVLSLLGAVRQQSCAVHLERNLGKLVGKPHRSEFQKDVSQIFKRPSLSQARDCLAQVLDSWQHEEPEACLYLQANVDKSLRFYEVATSAVWRAHLKSTNILERFFRELKRFEKSRQFRFANQTACERFYYLFARDYNQRHRIMPKLTKRKTVSASSAQNAFVAARRRVFSAKEVLGHPPKKQSPAKEAKISPLDRRHPGMPLAAR
jgi:transposase-like protein